jgi:hypothetical protein
LEWPTQGAKPCFPSRNGVATVVMKNCEPLVFGPALAIDSRYLREQGAPAVGV